MQIAVKANDTQKEEFISKGFPREIKIIWLKETDLLNIADADIYFDLLFDETDIKKNCFVTDKMIFVNAVTLTCKELPENYIRINAWNGFLKREILEVCAANKNKEIEAGKILQMLNWKYQFVPDTPGMIAARIVSMIINEAYFGLGDEISTKEEIDIAMKLGTNYPYGPFEWAEKIGLEKIYFLLKKLSEQDARYAIAKKLAEEINF